MDKRIEVTEELTLEDLLRLIMQTLPCFRSWEEMLQEICNTAIDRRGFDLAWAGLVDEATGRLDPWQHGANALTCSTTTKLVSITRLRDSAR